MSELKPNFAAGDISDIADENGVLTDPEMIRRVSQCIRELIPVLESHRPDVAACALADVLGQNTAWAARATGVPLETLVDRITLAVRSRAEQDLADANDAKSNRQN